MGDRKQPTPVPLNQVKPDPPPAPPQKVFGIPVRIDATLCASDELWIESPAGAAERAWPKSTRTLLDGIIKNRQLLLQAGAPVDGLTVRLHPSDYMTLGLEAHAGGLVRVDCAGHEPFVSVLGMSFERDTTIAIGAPVVERAKRTT